MTILAVAVRLHFAVLMGLFYFWSEHQIFRGLITTIYAIFLRSMAFLGFFFCLFREQKKNKNKISIIKINTVCLIFSQCVHIQWEEILKLYDGKNVNIAQNSQIIKYVKWPSNWLIINF